MPLRPLLSLLMLRAHGVALDGVPLQSPSPILERSFAKREDRMRHSVVRDSVRFAVVVATVACVCLASSARVAKADAVRVIPPPPATRPSVTVIHKLLGHT